MHKKLIASGFEHLLQPDEDPLEAPYPVYDLAGQQPKSQGTGNANEEQSLRMRLQLTISSSLAPAIRKPRLTTGCSGKASSRPIRSHLHRTKGENYVHQE